MTVYQYRPERPWQAVRIFRRLGADVYHSQDTSLATALAQVAAPRAAHVVTFRDPMDRAEWRVEPGYARSPGSAGRSTGSFITNPFVAIAVRRADGLYCAAEFLIPKAAQLYGLRRRPRSCLRRSRSGRDPQGRRARPVCYMGRWDGRKRVELFFELARRCPDVEFVAAGAPATRCATARCASATASIPNLHMTGVLDQFATPAWSDVLGRSWILVNTSAREGLPTAFIEAAAHRCAILSFADPDGFATRFGRRAEEGRLDDRLRELLEGDRWATLGESGREYVEGVFSIEHSIDAHERHTKPRSAGAGAPRR